MLARQCVLYERDFLDTQQPFAVLQRAKFMDVKDCQNISIKELVRDQNLQLGFWKNWRVMEEWDQRREISKMIHPNGYDFPEKNTGC